MRTYQDGQPEDRRRCVVEVSRDAARTRGRQCKRDRGFGAHGLLCWEHADRLQRGGHVEIPFDPEVSR